MSRSKTQKTISKREKYRLTEDQLRLLEASFNHEKKLEPERKFHLAFQVGMPAKQVAIWYQNKRARWKAQNIELNHRTIQQKLETALAETQELQKEVDRLRMELHKAQQALMSLNLVAASTFGDEYVGSSRSAADVAGGWQMEELYAMLNHNNNTSLRRY